MTKIKLIELKGSSVYSVSVNNAVITIHRWTGGFELLKKFIQECGSVLLGNDLHSISILSGKYGLSTPKPFLTISQAVFRELIFYFMRQDFSGIGKILCCK